MKRDLDRPRCRRESETLFGRVLSFLGFRSCTALCGDLPFDEFPPDSFVREPRRPCPCRPGGAVALELPDVD
jgi:hypothetical protein